jgi:hypothetical protein
MPPVSARRQEGKGNGGVVFLSEGGRGSDEEKREVRRGSGAGKSV